MRKNELSLVISYLAATVGLVWILHIVGTYDKHPKRPEDDPNQLAKSIIGKETAPARG